MSKQRELLTYELVRELFDYRDGGLYWKSSRNGVGWPGDRFGSIKDNGYRTGHINRVGFSEHRLIFMWHHGYYPENDIDHIDRNRINNNIENLREVSRSCNNRNSSIRIENKTGVRGVCEGSLNTFCVSIGKKYIGCYSSMIDAVVDRWKAEVEHGYPNCNSTSSAYTYLKEHGLIDGDNNLIKCATV